MMETAVARYRKVVATTQTPGELLLALYGGLFRFLKQARLCTESKQHARAAELASKARAIIFELDIALDHEAFPELCRNLTGVYGFCLDRLLAVSRERTVKPIDEVIRVLSPLYQAWEVAVPQAQREQGRADAPRAK
jgi:flagellar protein FliS